MLAAALALGTTGTARAAEDAATRQAQARFTEGIKHAKAGQFELARLSFAQAYSVLRKPEILWNLALAEEKSQHPVDAIGHFKQLVQLAKTDGDKAGAQKHVSDLQSQTAHIDVAAAPGSQVSLDGAVVGFAPLPDVLDVAAGKHHVDVRSAQGLTRSADTDATLGQTSHVSFQQVDSAPPGGAIAAGGATPGATSPGGAGATGADPAATGASGAPGADTTAPASGGHHRFWDARGITVVTLGGLALVSGGLGLAFGVASNNDANNAASLRTQNPSCAAPTTGCQQLASAVNAQHSDHVTSEGFWIGSAVLAAGAVAAWFLWPRSADGSGSAAAVSLHVVPTAGPAGAGAVAVGSF